MERNYDLAEIDNKKYRVVEDVLGTFGFATDQETYEMVKSYSAARDGDTITLTIEVQSTVEKHLFTTVHSLHKWMLLLATDDQDEVSTIVVKKGGGLEITSKNNGTAHYTVEV